MVDSAEVQKLLDQAKNEIDKEDHDAAVEEMKKYLKQGRWDRLNNPVFQRGFRNGFIAASIVWAIILFLFGPFLFGD